MGLSGGRLSVQRQQELEFFRKAFLSFLSLRKFLREYSHHLNISVIQKREGYGIRRANKGQLYQNTLIVVRKKKRKKRNKKKTKENNKKR